MALLNSNLRIDLYIHQDQDQTTAAKLDKILAALTEAKTQETKIMAGIDDLRTAVADVATNQQAATDAISTEIAAVEAAIAKLQAGGLTDAEAEALAQSLEGNVANLKTASDSLTAETTKLQGI